MKMYDAKSLNLLRELTISQYKLKDQSSFFGLIWSLLNPLLMLGVLFVFFNARMGSDIENYPLYLLLGLVMYTHFTNATSLGMRALKATRELTTDTIFPKEFLVFSAVLSSTIELVVSVFICLGIAFFLDVEMTGSVLWLPFLILTEMILVTWVSLVLAAVFPFAWDIDHIYHVFLRALFFLTPIFYDVSFVGDGIARAIVDLNPLAYVIEVSRSAIMGDGAINPSAFASFALINLVLSLAGFMLFKRLEPQFAEHV